MPASMDGTAFDPSYLALEAEGKLSGRAEAARELLSPCVVCPRRCRTDRSPAASTDAKRGFCRTGFMARVSSCNSHHGEEPPISASRGSGTIFFASCNMACFFCQNYPISQLDNGRLVDDEALAGMMLELQRMECHNVNFVTPSHVVPQILAALAIAVGKGFRLPLVYNSGGYDSVETLKLLDGVVDIYMPDIKYSDNEAASRLSGADDYVEVNRAALKEMHRQVGDLETRNGVALRGLLVRHLVLPHGFSGTGEAMRFIAEGLSRKTYVSLMSQYFPANKAPLDKEMNRRLTRPEYAEALEALETCGLDNGWIQGEP